MTNEKQVCKNCGKRATWNEYRGFGKTLKELYEDHDLCDECYWDTK